MVARCVAWNEGGGQGLGMELLAPVVKARGLSVANRDRRAVFGPVATRLRKPTTMLELEGPGGVAAEDGIAF